MADIIYYDAAFYEKLDALGAALESGDPSAVRGVLRAEFDFLFKAAQAYWKQAARGGLLACDEADEVTRRELTRPLSHRQYRKVEQAFQARNDWDALCAIWDFLDDEGAVRRKTVMSPAEVDGISLILEQAYCRLADLCDGKPRPMYGFYGWDGADIEDERGLTPRDYYDLLTGLWSADTCAPRMRKDWTRDNPTLGQCSVTAFQMQDIYGGEVRGVPLPDGGVHCFNAVGDCVFDLTSEQFGDVKLDYANRPVQRREDHFAKAEKKARYETLKARLMKALSEEQV